MNDTKQLPDGLQPLPEGAYYAGTLADFEGCVNGWVSDGPHDKWIHGRWDGMKCFPNDDSAGWHVALPIQDAPKQHDDGGPAFPQNILDTSFHWEGRYEVKEQVPGMTLRDWFAGKALEGTIASMSGVSIYEGKCLVSEAGGVDQFTAKIGASCYKYADAMLAARKGVQP